MLLHVKTAMGAYFVSDNNREVEFSDSLIEWVWKSSGDAKGSFPSRDF